MRWLVAKFTDDGTAMPRSLSTLALVCLSVGLFACHTRDDLSRRRKAGVVAWRCGEHVAHHRDGGDLHRKRNEYRDVALERAKRGGPDHSVIALSAP